MMSGAALAMAEPRLLERTLSNGARVRLVLEPLAGGLVRILTCERSGPGSRAFVARREWEGRVERATLVVRDKRLEDLPFAAAHATDLEADG